MGSTSGTKSLKEYLKRYESNNNEQEKKTKKKRTKPATAGVLIVDEDPIWQKPINLEEDSGQESAGEDNTQVEEDMEVKRLRKLEQLKARRGYNSIAEDGSGWNSWERVSSEGKDSNDQNIDLSPTCRQRVRNDTPSPEHQEIPSAIYRENIDLSPPRKRRTGVTYLSSKRETKHAPTSGLNSDLSPPRKRNARNDTDLKLLKDSRDFSPSQQQHNRNYSPSPQPAEKSVHSTGLNSDLSPPSKQGARHDTPSSSSWSENRALHNEDADAYLGPHLSPQRNSRNVSGIPPRSRKRSLERNPEQEMPKDLSPQRKYQKQNSGVSSSKEKPKTGLITGRDMREEISRKKKEDLLRIEQMDPSMSGRGAEGVHRDKKGDRISKEEYIKSKQKVEEKPKEKKLEWGKGLAQKREAEARLEEFEQEKDQPFARTRDDPQLDKMLKERLRWGDPMAHLVKNKNSELVLADLGESDKMKESGFIIPQEIPSHSWLKRGLDAAPNRYGIRPGRHWDGVDRSNGYEKQSFKRKNEKQATEKEAYMWSVSDM